MNLWKKVYKDNVRKGENAGIRIFSFSRKIFQPITGKNIHFSYKEDGICKYF